MRIFSKAAIIALVFELVCAGALFLELGGYLDRLHLHFLALAALILQFPAALLTNGSWADKLHPAVFAGIIILTEWFAWTLVFYIFLLIHARRRRNVVAEQGAAGNSHRAV